MRVTEQIDAMEASAVDPFRFLVATRVLACILMLPLLTLCADFCAGDRDGSPNDRRARHLRHFIESGPRAFRSATPSAPHFQDRRFYGFIIGIVACFQGMRTTGGTEGVGRSATSSVVLSSLFVILADVLLVKLIQVFYEQTRLRLSG